MEGIADEGGEEGVGKEEGREDEVGEVGGGGLEVFIKPRHGGCEVLGGVWGGLGGRSLRGRRFLRLGWGWGGWYRGVMRSL